MSEPLESDQGVETVDLRFGDCVFSLSGDPEDRSVFGAIKQLEGRWEPHIASVLRHCIRPNFVCLDIGANIGAHSVVMASIARDGQVLAFEASPRNCAYLKENARRNRLGNLRSENLALWNCRGAINFCHIDELAGCSFVGTDEVDSTADEKIRAVVTGEWLKDLHLHISMEKVNCVPLDDWVTNSGLDRVDLIKIDVEGAEVRVLQGSRATLSQYNPIVITEYNPDCAEKYFGQTRREYFDNLAQVFPLIFLIEINGEISPLESYAKLDERLCNGRGWEDLLCCYKLPLSLRDYVRGNSAP